jgi:cell division protein FtsB
VQISTAEKREQLAALQKKAEELKEKNAEYERLLNASDEKKYMEQLAIGQLGYAYPNEIRFYDISRN